MYTMSFCYLGSLQDWHQKTKVCEHLQNIVGLQEDLLSLRHRLKEIRMDIIRAQKKKEEYKSLNRCVQILCIQENTKVIQWNHSSRTFQIYKGHNVFTLFIKDKFCSPYRATAIQFYLLYSVLYHNSLWYPKVSII